MPYNSLKDLVQAGVKWELDDVAFINSDNTQKSTSKSNETPASPTSSVVPPIAPVQTIPLDTVKSMAMRPTDIKSLLRMIGEFNHPLRGSATNTVLPHIGQGRVLVLTDIPSSDDDARGEIMSGAHGDLLDKMIGAIGLTRDMVSISPMLFWRTPGGRTPTQQEIDLSRPFVDKIIELLNPRVILTLGTLPATEIAGINLAKSHGEILDSQNGIKIIPIFHPNYLTLKPAAKKDAWVALQKVQNILKNAE
ncbi:MAG: uracil-DNA glycosylase [Alphaproteobacteria bacterium]|nr:uracil-DNA glycosylase [Alphaproteobacteria bacterium]